MSTKTKRINRLSRGKDDYIIETLSTAVLLLFAIACIAPFFYVISISFTSFEEFLANPTRIIPRDPTLDAYRRILDYHLIFTGYRSTLIITILGTALQIFLLIITAYPLSKKDLKGRRFFLAMIMLTMFFSGGMIPSFLLIRNLGMLNSLSSLIIPGSISAFNLILVKNYIQNTIPQSLEDAAKVDGANDIRILFSVIVPLLKPILATMVVFISVHQWNSYFHAMLYIHDRNLWPLMLVLREIVQAGTDVIATVEAMLTAQERAHPFTLQMASIVVTTVPIMIVYPFMQKYFVKGIHLGSVKE